MLELQEIEGEDYGRDLVEVIRCRNCKFAEGMESSRYVNCQKFYSIISADGFCAWAKVKGDSRWDIRRLK